MASTYKALICFAVLGFVGCGAPLMDPLPPERDAANPDAAIPEYVETPNALTTSAFEGQKMDGGGHDHHGHGGHKGMDHSKHKGMDHSKHEGMDHSKHGTKKEDAK